MEQLTDFGIFLLRVVVIVIAVSFVLSLIFRALAQLREPGLRVRTWNVYLSQRADPLRRAAMGAAAFKAFFKARAKAFKLRAQESRKRIWVLDFEGDIQASQVDTLTDEINALLDVASDDDEVLVRVDSSGGSVIGYGLGASQLDRIRQRGLKLTVAVDRVAASGGYMMACVADRILAAPFAVIGSIGVIAVVPNAHRFLNEKGIDIHEFTAGRYKRTVTPFSEVTDERRAKLLEQLGDIHTLFKDYVQERRPAVAIEDVATGEYWFATRAMELGLVDEIITSDQWLLDHLREYDVHQIRTPQQGPQLGNLPGVVADAIGDRVEQRVARRLLPGGSDLSAHPSIATLLEAEARLQQGELPTLYDADANAQRGPR